MQPDEVAELLAPYSHQVSQLALELRALVQRLVPDAAEELDWRARARRRATSRSTIASASPTLVFGP